MTTEIVVPAEVRALSVLDRAKALSIVDKASYECAGALLKINLDGRKQVEAFFSPIKKSAADHHKSIVAVEKRELAPYDETEEILKSGMVKFVEMNAAIWPEEGDDAPPPEALSGVTEKWRCDIMDFKALVAHVHANPALSHLLMPNQKELDAMAGRQKEVFKLPGCAAVKTTGIRT